MLLFLLLITVVWFANNRSNNAQKQPGPEDTLRTVVIQERRLHVGVHNGWCFLEKPQVVVLHPQSLLPRGRADSSFKQSTLLRDRWASEAHAYTYLLLSCWCCSSASKHNKNRSTPQRVETLSKPPNACWLISSCNLYTLLKQATKLQVFPAFVSLVCETLPLLLPVTCPSISHCPTSCIDGLWHIYANPPLTCVKRPDHKL